MVTTLRSTTLVPALVLAVGFAVSPARAQVSDSAAAQEVARTFGVEVLRVAAGEVDGTKVWLITVMNPPGDDNAAFQVNTLAVDQRTGALVPAFRHRSSGYDLPAAESRGDRVGRRPDAARGQTWR